MNTVKYFASLFGTALLATVALTGCEVDAGIGVDGPDVIDDGSGSITIDWTIEGRIDDLACRDFGAASVDVQVYDDAGDFVTDATLPCEAFEGSIDLPDGSFSADVTLLDEAGNTVSTTATLDDLEVIDDTDLEAGVDFPGDARL